MTLIPIATTAMFGALVSLGAAWRYRTEQRRLRAQRSAEATCAAHLATAARAATPTEEVQAAAEGLVERISAKLQAQVTGPVEVTFTPDEVKLFGLPPDVHVMRYMSPPPEAGRHASSG